LKKEKDYVNPICPECNTRVCTFNSYSKKDGRPLFKKKCDKCRGAYERRPYHKTNPRQRKYIDAIKRKKLTMTCERCGFRAEHSSQLDIDHIDGNRNNNDPSNHQVLCANCHRHKTHTEKKPNS
jgi:predicted nucleic-acid-binding Zn-ribbon protein